MLGSVPGWPAVLADGPVTLRPYRRGDARAWSEVRIANQKWLAPWESSPPGPGRASCIPTPRAPPRRRRQG